ncbi:hypothetical protein JCM3765_003939 [Sporobolomyces pararoseus]
MSSPVQRTDCPAEFKEKEGLVLAYGNSPNGWKCCCALQALDEAGLLPNGFTAVPVFLQKDEQFTDWFTSYNPNSKMPFLVDNRPGKKPLVVFESGAILEFLARVYDKEHLYSFEDGDLYQEMINWIHLCQANLGPQQGQLNHFSRYTEVKCDYSHERFRAEVLRIYSVYDKHLSTRTYLVGDKLSFADFCTQPWMRVLFWASVDIDQFPSVAAYVKRIEELPLIQRALKVPEQDLVTRVKSNPDLERQIMERMKKAREEKEKEKEKEKAEQAETRGEI